VDPAVTSAVRESSAKGSNNHLLGGALVVAARLRTVNNATTAVLRHTNRTLTSTAGSLLLERLLTRTGNLTTAKRGLGSLAVGSKLRNYHLVNQWNVCGCVKKGLGQIYAA
jgi:hypothetical protein